MGLSGGVDSAVAAFLLREQGHRVVGVTLRLWSAHEAEEGGRCCSSVAVARAKAVASILRIPHVVVDATDVFCREVVDNFVTEYARGQTPNPCVRCNALVRFPALHNAAQRLGASLVATGHYARLDCNALLTRARDRGKDQSYVLAKVRPAVFRRVVFPLGDMAKTEVRAIADRQGILGFVAPESQEICFIPDNDYRAFLRARLGEQPGELVDPHGRVLGRHSGTYNYTVGQRRGLGHAAAGPQYVLGVDAPKNEVLVGPRSAGAIGGMVLADLVIHRPVGQRPTQVQFRSLGASVAAVRASHDTLVLLTPALGVALGQTAVLYSEDQVIFAGTIVGTRPWQGAMPHRWEPKCPVV